MNDETSNIWQIEKTHQPIGGARGVMVIVVVNEHGDTSSNPGLGWLLFI